MACKVSTILATFLHRARSQVGSWWARSSRPPTDVGRRAAAGAPVGNERHPQDVVWSLLLVLVVLPGIAALGWVRWPFALWTGGVMLGLYIVVSLALFLFAQRDLSRR